MSGANYQALAENRLALGTVQFGMPYGVANTTGQVGSAEVRNILEAASKAGIDTLDTAISYGNCESILGEADVSHWRVITKMPGLPEDVADVAEWVHGHVESSLKRLRIGSLDGLLLHRPGDLLGMHGQDYISALRDIKNSGMVASIGISIYDPMEIEGIWRTFSPDIVQAPLNVMDRRLVNSGWLQRLVSNGVRVHARSIFLQGLLLMGSELRPDYFSPWRSLLDSWVEWCAEQCKSPMQMALGFVLAQSGVERVVVGVDTAIQLKELVDAAPTRLISPPGSIQSDEIALINPSSWERRG